MITSYPVVCVGASVCPASNEDGMRFCRHYRFTSKGKNPLFPNQQTVYFVDAEYYDNDLFTLKYFPKSHRMSEWRYQVTAKSNDLHAIIATVHGIGETLLLEYPSASFAFIGLGAVHTGEDGQRKVEPGVSLRFRMYARYARRVPNAERFIHREWEAANAYLMLNKEHKDSLALENRIMDMFIRTHDNILDPRPSVGADDSFAGTG